METGDEAGENRGGVGDRSAVDARMQIGGGAGDADFEGGDATQSVGEGRNAGRDHSCVRNSDDIAGELVAVGEKKLLEMDAPDFLFAFDEHEEVHGEISELLERFCDPEEMRKNLSFVIGSTASKDEAIGDARGKGWSNPEVERIDGLDIIVAVNQNRAAPRLMKIASENDRMTCSGVESRLETIFIEPSIQPSGTSEDILSAIWVSGDARKTKKGQKGFEGGWIHELKR